MSMTNFARLTNEEKTIWAMDFWKQARTYRFLEKFTGTSSDSIIQRVTELKKTTKGNRAVITLIPDLTGDGVVGDRTLEGNEEGLGLSEAVIRYDQMRNATRHEGKMAEQKSVVTFREEARDKLAYWIADRSDQLAFLTMSGVSYAYNTNGSLRVGSDFPYLEFAADVTAPSTNRHVRWDATTGLEAGNTAAVAAADTPSWAMIVELKARAKNKFIRPIRTKDGIEFYHMFMTPDGMAKLKQDADYLANLRNAGQRGAANDLFKGTDTVMVDGIAISEYRHVFNTAGLTSGVDKWGAGSDVDGQRVLFCGAQALAYADLGMPDWIEEGFDYDNQQSVAIAKIQGFKKPVFYSNVDAGDEDFGLLVCDTAI